MSDRFFTMYIVGGNDAGFQFTCPAYSIEQAVGYAKHLYGFKIRVRDVREIK
jgi:hypothetical protein